LKEWRNGENKLYLKKEIYGVYSTKIHREEFIAKLGRKAGRILSALPGGGTKKQRQE